MRKIEIVKDKHYYSYTITGWMNIIENKVTNSYTNNLFVVSYEKEHLPLKYK